MRKRALLATLGIPLVAACGAAPRTANQSQSGGSAVSPSAGEASATTLNKVVWYAGAKITLVDATVVKPVKPSPGYSVPKTRLLINATFENLGPDNYTPYNLDLALQSGTNSYLDHDSQDEKIPEIPGLQRTNGVIAFFVDDKFSLRDAVLLVGNANNNQAKMPLGTSGNAVPLEPQKVAASGTLSIAGAFSVAVTGGSLSYDDPKTHREEKAGDVLLTLNFTVTGLADNTCCLSTENLVMKLPDGTAVAATRNSTYVLPGKGLTTPDETAEWSFKAADGAYDMIVKGKYGPNRADEQGELPFNITVGVSATGSGTPPAGGAFPSPSPDSTPQPSPSGH